MSVLYSICTIYDCKKVESEADEVYIFVHLVQIKK